MGKPPQSGMEVLCGLAMLTALAGGRDQLMPTPNLSLHSGATPWAGLAPELQSTTADLLYV